LIIEGWWKDLDPDADPDPAIFVIDLQDANKKLIIVKSFFCLLHFEGTFTSFFKDKMSKRNHKTVGIKVFLIILLDNRRMMEGSGSPPLTNGSGSGRPKNMWIRNTGLEVNGGGRDEPEDLLAAE
jgi:hypothetical protein